MFCVNFKYGRSARKKSVSPWVTPIKHIIKAAGRAVTDPYVMSAGGMFNFSKTLIVVSKDYYSKSKTFKSIILKEELNTDKIDKHI